MCLHACMPRRYEEGQNVSEVETLVGVAAELGLGLPEEAVRQYLQEDRGRREVLAEDATAKQE